MKAKELANILLQHPDLNVEFHYENLEIAEWEYVEVKPDGIFISEYNPETIVFTEKHYVDEMKRLDNEYADTLTKPR